MIPVNIVLTRASEEVYNELIEEFTSEAGKKTHDTKAIPAKYGNREFFALQVRVDIKRLPELYAMGAGYGFAKVIL